MTKQPKITSPLSDAIIDLLMEDILATSDEEIMEEVRKEYANEAEETKKLQELVLAAIQKSNKQKMLNAKKKFDTMQSNSMNNVHQLSLEDKKKLIARATQSIDDLTLAARNATDMAEQEKGIMGGINTRGYFNIEEFKKRIDEEKEKYPNLYKEDLYNNKFILQNDSQNTPIDTKSSK